MSEQDRWLCRQVDSCGVEGALFLCHRTSLNHTLRTYYCNVGEGDNILYGRVLATFSATWDVVVG